MGVSSHILEGYYLLKMSFPTILAEFHFTILF